MLLAGVGHNVKLGKYHRRWWFDEAVAQLNSPLLGDRPDKHVTTSWNRDSHIALLHACRRVRGSSEEPNNG